ncbi:MAG: eCIS core domain-containing protein [Limisphaerales bacterium]
MAARAFTAVVTRRVAPSAARPVARPAHPTRSGGAVAGLPRFASAPAAPTPVINQRGDRWEKEASRVAETIVRQPASAPAPIARPVPARPIHTALPLRPSPSPPPRGGLLPAARPTQVNPTPAIEGIDSPGTGLAPQFRRQLETVTGVGLEAVRVHTGPQAELAADRVHARAITVGSHIYLRAGESPRDARLLAHESAHAIQQTATLNAARPRGPPGSVETTPALSAAPTGLIQREPASSTDTAAPESEGFLEMGFWLALQHAGVAQRIIDVLREIRHVGLWEFLKRKLSGALNRVFDGLRNQGGFTARLADIFQGLLNRTRLILAALVGGDCQPLFAAVRDFRDTLSVLAGEAWDSITGFLQPIGDHLSGLWEKFGAPVADFLGEFAADTWTFISGLGNDLWNFTQPARDYASGIWTEVKSLLGFGEGNDDDAGGGLGDWIAAQAGEAWDELKLGLEPVIAPIRQVADQVAAILPLEAIFNLRDTVTTWMDQALQMADTMEEEGDLAEDQDLIRDIVLPGVRRAIAGVNEKLTAASAWVTGVIGDLVGQVTGLVGAIGSHALLGPLQGAVQWLSDEATALGDWARDRAVGIFDLARQALDTLNAWIEPVLRALQRLVATVGNLAGRLGDFVLGPFLLIPECIREPIKDFLIEKILSRIPVFAQLIAVPDLWARAQTVFRRIIVQVFRDGDLAGAAWTFFREVIQLFGLPPELVTNLLRNAARAIGDILRDPVGFLLNLFRALGTGFVQFLNHFASHLLNGIATWLFGALGETGVRVPTQFSLQAVVDVVLQVLDLTQERVFRAIERRVGPERAAQIRRGLGLAEEVLAWVRILATEGPAGLWRELLSRLHNLWETIVNGVMDFLVNRVVAFATRWIMSLLDVTGIMPVINSLVAIYHAIQSFVQYLRQLLEIVNSVFEGLGEIARGVIARGASLVEANLGRLMPIAIGFLANQIGLADLPHQVRRVVGGIRARVDQAMDWIVDRVVRGVQAVVGAVRSGVATVLGWLGLRRPFQNASGETHELYFRGQTDNAQLIVESTPRPLVEFLANYLQTQNPSAEERATIAQIRARVTEIETIKSAGGTRGRGSFSQSDGVNIQAKYEAILGLLARLRGDGTAPPPTLIIQRARLPDSGDGTMMIAHPLSLNPGGMAGGQPYEESDLWRAVSRRKRQAGGNTFYVRGHLLNHHLHGAGSRENMIPITSTANGRMERLAESQVKNAILHQNKVVRFEVEATGMNTHPGRTRIPEEARMPTNIRMLAKELRREGAAWIETPTVLVQESIPNVLPGDDEGFIATAV